jgi:hypothetical protein
MALMRSLIPEKRVDRNGHLVTKHVKASPDAKPAMALPSPVLSSPAAAPLHKDRTKQYEWHCDMYRKYPDTNLQSIVSQFGPAYGNITFQCSDVEAYDVLRASHGTNSFLLLNIGIRSKEEAVRFYTENDLAYLIEDNDEWVDQALARNIPAPHTLNMAGSWGSHAYRDQPDFLDALEANGVRVLRDIQSGYSSIPDLIMRGEISYDDVKKIGASRLAKAARKTSVIAQLQTIKAGKSLLDAESLKQLIHKYEYEGYPTHRFTDPITMAGSYGADTMLKLRNFERAANFLASFQIRAYAEHNRAEVITFQDDLNFWCAGRHSFTADDIFLLVESGVTARDAVKELDEGHSVLQIAAMAQNVQSSISSGWL